MAAVAVDVYCVIYVMKEELSDSVNGYFYHNVPLTNFFFFSPFFMRPMRSPPGCFVELVSGC